MKAYGETRCVCAGTIPHQATVSPPQVETARPLGSTPLENPRNLRQHWVSGVSQPPPGRLQKPRSRAIFSHQKHPYRAEKHLFSHDKDFLSHRGRFFPYEQPSGANGKAPRPYDRTPRSCDKTFQQPHRKFSSYEKRSGRAEKRCARTEKSVFGANIGPVPVHHGGSALQKAPPSPHG